MTLIPRSRGGALVRFALGAVIVVAFAATTTAVAGLLQFKQIAHYLSATPALPKSTQVTIPDPGNPQTLLLIGSDHRAGTSWSSSNTDTMMLVRLDPSSATINLLSVPRDLQVQIPEGGALVTGKLNSAYSIGGPGLLVRILKQQVFPGIQINHVIDVNFGGFIDLVNAVGCVYTDVDHRYYNDTALTDYSSIDLQPGYQKLCGTDALEFVRFRHTDTDIVRNARQQDFLRWVKDQFSPTQIVENRDTLLRIFGQHAQTDANLHTTDGLINLFNLVAFSAGHAVKQIPFPAILLPCPPPPVNATSATQQTPCYVTADQGAEQNALHQFMRPTTGSSAPAGVGAAAGPASSTGSSPAAGGSGAGSGAGGSNGLPKVAGLSADVGDGVGQARGLGNIGMPIYVPKLILTGSSYCSSETGGCPVEISSPGSYPRAYLIHDQQGNPHAAYRMTLVKDAILGQYYGVQGTTWRNPPILASPTETKVVNGKQLLLYANGGKISQVAWRTPQAVYWISNTLTDDISNQQMVAIASSLTPVAG